MHGHGITLHSPPPVAAFTGLMHACDGEMWSSSPTKRTAPLKPLAAAMCFKVEWEQTGGRQALPITLICCFHPAFAGGDGRQQRRGGTHTKHFHVLSQSHVKIHFPADQSGVHATCPFCPPPPRTTLKCSELTTLKRVKLRGLLLRAYFFDARLE